MTSVPQTATGWVEIGKGKYQITAWVTKYALTNGIMKVTAEWSPNYPGKIAWRKGRQLVGVPCARRRLVVDRGRCHQASL